MRGEGVTALTAFLSAIALRDDGSPFPRTPNPLSGIIFFAPSDLSDLSDPSDLSDKVKQLLFRERQGCRGKTAWQIGRSRRIRRSGPVDSGSGCERKVPSFCNERQPLQNIAISPVIPPAGK